MELSSDPCGSDSERHLCLPLPKARAIRLPFSQGSLRPSLQGNIPSWSQLFSHRLELHQPEPYRQEPHQQGLSAYLSHQCEMEKLLQLCRLKDRESAFHVITAGELPPGPVELLSSKRMQELLQKLRERYDYVILDLPPVGEFSDALAVAGEADGMILVIRRGICTGGGLTTAVAQLQSVDARILGAVYNCSTEKSCYGSKDYSRIYQ